MNEQTPPAPQDRLVALSGLAASTVDAGPCPTDSALAAFVDGALKGDALHDVRHHVAHCPTCHQHWIEVSAAIAEAATVRSPARPGSEAHAAPAIRRRLGRWFVPFTLAVPAFAALVAVAVVVQWPSGASIGDRVDLRYSVTAAGDAGSLAGAARSLARLSLPWEADPVGFVAAGVPDSARAFGAGILDGRAELLAATSRPSADALERPARSAAPDWSETDWSATPWADYYHLGRWSTVLWVDASAAAEGAAPEWPEHRRIASELRDRFAERPTSEREAVETTEAIEEIESLLADAGTPDAGVALMRRLRVVMSRLAPASP